MVYAGIDRFFLVAALIVDWREIGVVHEPVEDGVGERGARR